LPGPATAVYLLLDVPFNPAALALLVPFMLLVLLYFQRKRRHEQNRAGDAAAERLETADSSRLLQELLQIEIDEDVHGAEPAFKAFLRGEPTRWLTAEWFYSVYHGAIGLVLLAVVATLIIRDALANPIVANVVVATVLIPLAIAWAIWRSRSARYSDRIRAALSRVLHVHDLRYGAVIDRRWRVIGTAGEFDRLHDADLAPLLLGRKGEAMRTYRALEWMPLPQIVTMEQTEAIADKPSPTLAVVVFGHRNTFTDSEQRAASVAQAIRDEFGTFS